MLLVSDVVTVLRGFQFTENGVYINTNAKVPPKFIECGSNREVFCFRISHGIPQA